MQWRKKLIHSVPMICTSCCLITLLILCFPSPPHNSNSMGDYCPWLSPYLKGSVPVVDINRTETQNRLIDPLFRMKNGSWSPSRCKPVKSVAIIIPYRDREWHLNILIRHLIPILQKQLIEFGIYVVEHLPGGFFNKGVMNNIGFKHIYGLRKYDCVIFHDVDLLMENDKNLFDCSINEPHHLSPFVKKFNYRLIYYGLFGGVISFTIPDFILLNGYSNEYFGWGAEDDDMFRRMKNKKMSLFRPASDVGRYTNLMHPRDKGNPINRLRRFRLKFAEASQDIDGLSSLQRQNYKIHYEGPAMNGLIYLIQVKFKMDSNFPWFDIEEESDIFDKLLKGLPAPAYFLGLFLSIIIIVYLCTRRKYRLRYHITRLKIRLS